MSHCPMIPSGMGPECTYFRADGEPLRKWEAPGCDQTGIATCTYWAGGGYAATCGIVSTATGGPDVMLCRNCRHWRPDVLAHPENPEPGSLRVCAIERVTHSGSWCSRWRERTPEQVIEQANDAGRLF